MHSEVEGRVGNNRLQELLVGRSIFRTFLQGHLKGREEIERTPGIEFSLAFLLKQRHLFIPTHTPDAIHGN